MKKTNLILLLFISLFFVNVKGVAQKRKSITAINHSQERALQQVISILTKAMVDADSISLGKLTHDSLSYGHSGGVVENKSAFLKKITSGASDFVSIDLSNQQLKLFGNTAIVRHDFFAKTNDKGVAGEIKLKVLQVWICVHRQWKLLARQSVKMP